MGSACFRGIVLEINNHSGPFSNDGAGGEERMSASVIACVGLTAQFGNESHLSAVMQPWASLSLWDQVIYLGPLSNDIPALTYKPLEGRGCVSLHPHHPA